MKIWGYGKWTLAAVFATALAPCPGWAACRICNLGLDGLLPQVKESTLSVEYGLSDQTRNWSGTAEAPAAANTDKIIRDDFFITSGEFVFAGGWSARVEIPLIVQTFKTDENGPLETFRHSALGDIRVMGLYSRLLESGSASLLLGFKLPTGEAGFAGFPRDTQIGTGSTDILLGFSYEGALTSDEAWSWSGEIAWSKPLAVRDGFLPGSEMDAAFAISYNGFSLGGIGITPMLQWSGSSRTKDGGAFSDPANTGCDRVLLSPGVELALGKWKLAGDVEFPVYQDVNGNQLVADRLYKLVVSYSPDGEDA